MNSSLGSTVRLIVSLVTNYYIRLQGSIQITVSNTNASFEIFRDVSFLKLDANFQNVDVAVFLCVHG